MTRLLALALLFTLSITWAREVPPLKGPIVDEVGLIPWSLKKKLELGLADFKKQTGNQVQVLIIEGLEDETIEGFSIKVTDKWKLGSSSADNGVLFLLAMKERQMRIEVGQGLEGVLTDAKSGRIIDATVPFFRQGKYADGIVVALNSITHTLGGELKNVPVYPTKRRRDKTGLGFFVFLIVLMMLFGRGRRSSLAWFLLGNIAGRGGRSYGGFSGGGLGGGWSGGGGGFSGGGASGRW